jgi:hypothetical protein
MPRLIFTKGLVDFNSRSSYSVFAAASEHLNFHFVGNLDRRDGSMLFEFVTSVMGLVKATNAARHCGERMIWTPIEAGQSASSFLGLRQNRRWPELPKPRDR